MSSSARALVEMVQTVQMVQMASATHASGARQDLKRGRVIQVSEYSATDERERIRDRDRATLRLGEMPPLDRILNAARYFGTAQAGLPNTNTRYGSRQRDHPLERDLARQRRVLHQLALVASLDLVDVRVDDALNLAA